MKGKGFHVDVVQEHLEKEAEVSFQFTITGAGGQWVEERRLRGLAVVN